MTTFLKFKDEAEAISVLSAFRMKNENGDEGWITASHTHALDPIGTLYHPTGNMLTGEFGEYPEMVPSVGYHINFIGELPAEILSTYAIEVLTHAREFALS